MPTRRQVTVDLAPSTDSLFEEFHKGTGEKQEGVSTTMVVRAPATEAAQRQAQLGRRIVPIVPDEARTFGMDPLFSEFKIYSALGQNYTPVDAEFLVSYKEGKDGQILEEGITEAGAMGSMTAAGTSHSAHGEPMIPFYILYSMFGFQRIGDSLWSFADQRGRGFLLGATAGRTTLNGEGLQHQDGHSHLIATANPACVAYDPAYAYEVAVLIEDGLRRMYVENEDVFYYLTLYNENYVQPAMPEGDDVREGICKGLYRVRRADKPGNKRVQLIGSGPILRLVLEAADTLASEHGVDADVWSATSFSELRREAQQADEHGRKAYVTECLEDTEGPIVCATDFMSAVPDLVAPWLPRPMTTLGTDGFGCSDLRETLREHFGIDKDAVVKAALARL